SESVIRRVRRGLGITRYFDQKRKWYPAEEDLLGTMTDNELAEVLGRCPAVVAARRREKGISPFVIRPWSDEEDEMLGTMPDERVAFVTKRSIDAVKTRRSQKGVVPFGGWKRAPWNQWEIDLLGTVPDKDLATRLGRSYGAVRKTRANLGIAPYTNGHSRNGSAKSAISQPTR
ncbi:MAG: hypothetical protein ACPGVU_13185, partial [Limisphaerales bacterium]